MDVTIPDITAVIEREEALLDKYVDQAFNLVINADSEQQAVALAVMFMNSKDGLDRSKKETLKDAKKTIREVESLCKRLHDKADTGLRAIKDGFSDHLFEKFVEEEGKKVEGDGGTAYLKKNELLIIEDESLIPDHFWTREIDKARIMDSHRHGHTVPGTRVNTDYTTVIRRD